MSVTPSLQIDKRYLLSGEISRQVRNKVESRDWRKKSYLEICEFAEGEIRRRGGTPAFPVNVCANASAAHYTAEIGDQKMVDERALLKIDIGVHVEGFITDTAVTLCYADELLDMTEATKSALSEAIKGIKVGVGTGDIGEIVESCASRRGYLPIQNLAGHSLEQYEVHAGVSVPNVWSHSHSAFKQDKVYAVEPFFTMSDGSGIVVESRTRNIFGLVTRKKTKEKRLNEFLDLIWNSRRTLPFAARWFNEEYSKSELSSIIGELLKMKLIRAYPELVESKGTPVAQAEHSVATTAQGVVVLT
ncbi:MAG: type II methionyl aminopeptidase [Nitrososphaerales archaeon]